MNYINWFCLATVLWVCSFAAEAGVGSNSVVDPPLITLHPNYVSDHLYIQPDSSPLLLPCLCDGGPVRFSWRRNNVPVEQDKDLNSLKSPTFPVFYDAEPPSVNGVFNGSLVIVGTSEEVAGDYQCFASLLAQPHIRTMSEIAHVHKAIYVTFPDQDLVDDKKTVTEGEYVKLPCQPIDMTPPPRVTWEVVDKKVQLIDNRRIVQDDQGTLHILSVMPNGSEFAGKLRCDQQNKFMLASAHGRFTLLTLDKYSHGAIRKPKAEYVSSSPVYITAATGEQAVYCIFSGNPPPTVNWTRVDKRELGAGVVARGALLVFRNATLDESATYQCAVSSAAPGFASSTTLVRKFTVVVRSAPRTLPGVTKASRVDKTVGDRVNLNCGAEGEPTPTYSWYFNTLPLDSPINRDVARKLLSNINSPQLDLIELDNRSIGVYSCNVSNAVGHKFISFALNVFNESRLQATIYNSSIRNLIELRCTAQVDAGQRFDLYWKRLPNGDENKDASHYDNNRLTEKPQDGVYVSLIRSEATVKIDLNAINSTQQRLKWIVNRTYECVLETTTGNLSSHVFVALGQQQVVQDESTPGFRYWLALVGGAVALVFAVVCLSLAFYYGCKTQGESYLVDKLERAHGNNPLAELKASGFSEYLRLDNN